MNQTDFQKAADRVKKCMRGVSPQQVGGMKIEENEGGCDLVIQYTTNAPRFDENGHIRTIGIHFNNTVEAEHACNVMRYGEADLDTSSDNTPDRRYDTPFNLDL